MEQIGSIPQVNAGCYTVQNKGKKTEEFFHFEHESDSQESGFWPGVGAVALIRASLPSPPVTTHTLLYHSTKDCYGSRSGL